MRYDTRDILHEVSFRAQRGEVLALLGPNGAGKTTTMEILEGFRKRSAGHVQVLGRDPAHGDDRWRARFGLVLQTWRDHGKWRVREFLAYQGGFYTRYATADAPRPWDVDGLLAAVDLTAHADRQVRTLSGGQRRRLDLAVGLVGCPELLFLDEPTAGLDPEARRDFHALVRKVSDERRTTILMTTHDLDEAGRLADRILVLSGGRLIASGTPGELTRQMAGADTVSWVQGGVRLVQRTTESTRFVRALFDQFGDEVTELDVRRASLEDAYLALVRQAAEQGGQEVA